MKNKFSLTVLFSLICTACFFVSCKKSDKAVVAESLNEQTVEVIEEEVYDFYSPAEDNASWVEALLVHVEEERIAEELAKMEESLSDYQLEDEENDIEASENEVETQPENEGKKEKSSVEKFFEEAREGKTFTGKNNQMKFYEFENEILMPQETKDGYILINANQDLVQRNFYDKSYKLVKKEEWKIKIADEANKLRTEEFIYSPDTKKLIRKIIETPAASEIVSYNEAGFPVASEKYETAEEKKYIVMERTWLYDEENRILQDEQKEYSYKDSDYEKSTVFVRKYEYKYKEKKASEKSEEEEEIPPDLKYYENGVLKMQNQYTPQKGTYSSWIYFDSILSVKTYYEDEVRVRDEYYNKGVLFRKKVYEKAPTAEKE